jgi:hypothetical protein
MSRSIVNLMQIEYIEQQMKLLVIAFIVFVVYIFITPSSDERFDTGYSDGYASGYNTTCKIRATLVEGDWSNEHYKEGYNQGYSAGAADCRAGI